MGNVWDVYGMCIGCIWGHIWGFHSNGGIPTVDGLFYGKSHLEMDENCGYPHLRKPPFGNGS